MLISIVHCLRYLIRTFEWRSWIRCALQMFRCCGSLPSTMFSIDSSASAFGFGYEHQQRVPMHNGEYDNAKTRFFENSPNSGLRKTRDPIDDLTDANSRVINGISCSISFLIPISYFWSSHCVFQVGLFWDDDDLHSIVQMGFGQNQPQSYQGMVGHRSDMGMLDFSFLF